MQQYCWLLKGASGLDVSAMRLRYNAAHETRKVFGVQWHQREGVTLTLFLLVEAAICPSSVRELA
jgi:hypothetical protein